MKDIVFNPAGFIDGLKFMGLGLLGTFVVIGVIIGATMLFNYTANRISAKMAEKAAEQSAGEDTNR